MYSDKSAQTITELGGRHGVSIGEGRRLNDMDISTCTNVSVGFRWSICFKANCLDCHSFSHL